VATTRLPTKWGEFHAIGFQEETYNGIRRLETALALLLGDVMGNVPLVRIHSQCLTGDTLGSLRCDCGEQLDLAMTLIAREQCGLLIYEHQEGRGIGLMAKLQAYRLQDSGLDTVEANHALGFPTDDRDFGLPIAVLRDLGISMIRLLSNNPDKSRALLRRKMMRAREGRDRGGVRPRMEPTNYYVGNCGAMVDRVLAGRGD
jgi:GTP cyclohydrolase II